MPEIPAVKHDLPGPPDAVVLTTHTNRSGSYASFHELWTVLERRRLFVAVVVGGLLLACLLYCLVAPNVYEANARVALRATPAIALNLDGVDGVTSGAFASGQVQLETLANVFRSDQLAWQVISASAALSGTGVHGELCRKISAIRSECAKPRCSGLPVGQISAATDGPDAASHSRFADSLQVKGCGSVGCGSERIDCILRRAGSGSACASDVGGDGLVGSSTEATQGSW